MKETGTPPILENQEQLLQALRRGDGAVFEQLYRRYFPMVFSLIKQNQGNMEDAKEVFQETMLVLFKKVRDKPQFEFTAAPGTFIYAVARNQWYLRLRASRRNTHIAMTDTMPFQELEDPAADAEEAYRYNEQELAVSEMLSAMNPDCRNLIEAAFYQKLSGAAIAEKLGYTEAFVKVKKFRCMEELRKMVKNHTLWKTLPD